MIIDKSCNLVWIPNLKFQILNGNQCLMSNYFEAYFKKILNFSDIFFFILGPEALTSVSSLGSNASAASSHNSQPQQPRDPRDPRDSRDPQLRDPRDIRGQAKSSSDIPTESNYAILQQQQQQNQLRLHPHHYIQQGMLLLTFQACIKAFEVKIKKNASENLIASLILSLYRIGLHII